MDTLTEPHLAEHPGAGAVRAAFLQIDARIGEPEANADHILAGVETAAGLGARFVAAPECALTGYCFADRDEAQDHALTGDDRAFTLLLDATRRHGIALEVGYLERDGDRLRNTAAILDQGRVVATYRKAHLPHLGVDRWVDPGSAPFTPTGVAGLKVGLQICYDASFPEASRCLALAGAELILIATNWPAEAIAKADWLPNTRAYENVVYCAAVNRVGTERGFAFPGLSRVCGPDGETLVQGPRDREALLVADLYPERARTKRIERRGPEYFVDRIGHRRPELYGLPPGQ